MNADATTPDDDDSSVESLSPYECGHWIWDDEKDQLTFISNLPTDQDLFTLPKPDLAKMEFNDDIDVFEQQRFKKRYQRKGQEDDVIYLQDIVDLVLYTAPQEILSSSIIKILHLSVTDTFLRALIFFCQYYLQIDFEMERRTAEAETRIPTEYSYAIQDELMDDLADLRLLVAKEYASMVLGEGAMRHFHHMGPSKNGASLSQRDIDIHEVFIKISIQIVWIALGRKFYSKIETEVNRVLKSDVYNSADHKMKANFVTMMTPEQRHVLFGENSLKRPKYSIHSPLLDEVLSKNHTDYRKFGLGNIKYPHLPNRLVYMERALVTPEPHLQEMNVSVGILGLPRNRFDIMLREIKRLASHGSTTSVLRSRTSQLSQSFSNKSQTSKAQQKRAYPMIVLPSKGIDDETPLPESFPQKKLLHSHKACLHEQRQKWLHRHARLTSKKTKQPKSLGVSLQYVHN